jgi:hypothetical protein
MLDCILRGLALFRVFALSDLSIAISTLFLDSLVLWESETCERDVLLSLERLRLIDKLGRRIVLVMVVDLLGTSIFPAATKVCEGNSSGPSVSLK